MNGLCSKAMLALVVGLGAVYSSGCHCYRKLVDPCYPERYNYMARESVLEGVGNQAANGHVLDQTVWNYFFEVDAKGQGTANLNALGKQHLTYLARRRPNPDPKVYLQTANDLPYNPAEDPEKFAQERSELDSRRLQSVHKFLQARTTGRNLGYDFVISIHDPAEVGIAATPIGGNVTPPARIPGAIPQLYQSFTGALPLNVGGSYGTPGGGTGTGGGTTGGGTTGGTGGGY